MYGIVAATERRREGIRMGELERLIEDSLQEIERPRSWLATKAGINDKTLSSWFRRGRKSPPPAAALRAIARVLEIDVDDVMRAAFIDAGYARAAELDARAGRSWSEHVSQESHTERPPDPPPSPVVQPPESDVG